MREIRVLVTDDSAVIRQMISDFIDKEPGMKVVGKAKNGRELLELLPTVKPDVVTLDIQMPGMDGLAALEEIMRQFPLPVIMVSTLTQRGATISFEALDKGAFDYIAKPERGTQENDQFRVELLQKIRLAAGADIQRILAIRQAHKRRVASATAALQTPVAKSGEAPLSLGKAVIAIGISTGGPPALARLFSELAPPMPPILVVQHMPPNFTKALSWRLNSLSPLTVKEAEHGDPLRPNHVYIAPGGIHMEVIRSGMGPQIVLRQGQPVSGHKPSVDVMMTSAARLFSPRILGVIMTGMGRDGVEGCRAIREAGGFVLGQDEASSDVYGMNKAALVQGYVDRQFHLSEAASVITAFVREQWLGEKAVPLAGKC
jgi:two-component system chemotaxis response regulator CheB